MTLHLTRIRSSNVTAEKAAAEYDQFQSFKYKSNLLKNIFTE